MVLLIDNYDSFVFNLSRYLEELNVPTRVVRNDAITVEEIRGMQPQAILLSPGPCGPEESGVCIEVVRQLASQIPILGVCLGHQVIAHALGGKVVRGPEPVHGRPSAIYHTKTGLYAGLTSPMTVGRYHSLVVDEATLPCELEVTARTEDGTVMSLRHRVWPLASVQFHPESVLTTGGHRLLANFLALAEIPHSVSVVGDLPGSQISSDFYTQPISTPAYPLPCRH